MAKNLEVAMKKANIFYLLGLGGEINFILDKKNLGLDKNLKLRENLEVVIVDKLNRVLDNIRNYQIAVHKYMRYDSETELYSFLHKKNFLTSVVVWGFVPEILKDAGYIIKVSKETCAILADPSFAHEIENVKNWVRENPEIVSYEIDALKNAKNIINNQVKNSLLFTYLRAVVRIYAAFFRDKYSEETARFLESYVEVKIKRWVKDALEYLEACDAQDAIRKIVNEYLERNVDYFLGNIDSINEEADIAIKSGKVVLYDAEYYYISDDLFRKACGSLADIISFIEIKKVLREEEILLCNETRLNSFTVKRIYTNSNGEPCRGRFIKLRKEFLTSQEGLSLEERKSRECILEKATGTHYKQAPNLQTITF